MAQFGCGGSRCTCVVTAGPGVTVTGNGSSGAPYVIEGTVTCDQVRPCLSAGNGIAYDATTGKITARVSADAGNRTVIGTDGGIYTPAGSSTALQAGDTNTVDATVTGTGTAADPFVVAADVIVAPEPNGLEATADGLLVAPSADAGNQLTMGTDGSLFVPPDAPLEVGCGLQGDGTTAAPLAAFPVAGEQPWTDDWDCDAAANSTLKCDPGTGALWTPPEHSSAAVTFQQSYPVGGRAFTNTGGAVLVDPDAWSLGTYTADSLTTCRGVTYSIRFTGHLEVSWTANATFDVGYAVEIDGGALAVRLGHSILAAGPAGRERWTFNVSEAAVLPPHTGKAVRVYPVIRVTAGTATIQQWITDIDLLVITR